MKMEADKPEDVNTGRSFDSAYSFSFSIALGLILFIAGLVISLTFGNGTSMGLIFGVPLIIAGLVLPLIMMRDHFKQNEVSGVCPACFVPIKTSDATISLKCPACGSAIVVRDGKLRPAGE